MTPDRLHRSELAVPGSNVRMLEKAPSLGADVVFLDLEDAVLPAEKGRARENVVGALKDLDWSSCSVSVRVNALDTPWCYRDIVEIVSNAGDVLDLVLVPKVSDAGDVAFVATLLDQLEAEFGWGRIGISCLIETAEGLVNVREIAAAGRGRLEALVFGVADYSASVRARVTSIGGTSPDYMVLSDAGEGGSRSANWLDLWQYPMSVLVVTCRSFGLRPIDGPYGDIADQQGYVAAARRAAALGFEGKWAIHPSQVPLANAAFTPTDGETRTAQEILDALSRAGREGRGAATLDGKLIDAASERMASQIAARLKAIEGRGR